MIGRSWSGSDPGLKIIVRTAFNAIKQSGVAVSLADGAGELTGHGESVKQRLMAHLADQNKSKPSVGPSTRARVVG